MKRIIFLVLIFIISQFSEAQNGTVYSYMKISQTQPSFPITLWNGAQFGNALTSIGDLDNNGIPDLAITSVDGINDGKLFITFLDSGGIVSSMVEIKQGLFGLPTSQTYDMDWFGHSIDTIGDLNQDGVVDLIVGLPYIVGGNSKGFVFILFLNSDGTVNSHSETFKITSPKELSFHTI